MSRMRGIHEKEDNTYKKLWSENLNERDHFQDPDTNGRIMPK